ncbi:MAG TPA: glycosyltransferase family 1 protein, partial [Archaeoglobus sp.]|nr:glycosyltransferase family 1 protein [Archaeoglobus sp.]
CRMKLGLERDKKIILFLSAIRYAKGPDILVKAIPEIKKNVPEAQLILAGKGVMKTEIEQLIDRLGISSSIATPGFIKEADKPLYYKSADIFVLPSREDCLPLVILESMSSGVPIVATKVGGIPEIVQHGETGLLVPPNDPHALATAIVYLLTNENIRKHIANKARNIVKNYSWEKITEQTEKLYRELVNG